MHSRSRAIPPFLAGLAAVCLPYLSTLLDSESGFLYRDLTNVQVPLKAEWIRAVHTLGRLPHWDPFHLGGAPFLTDPSNGPLYPLNVFFLLFRPENAARALVFFILLHHLLLYCGGFLLARDFRVRPVLCAAAGLLFALSGYAISSDNLIHILCAQTAVPFFFLFWRRNLRRECAGIDLALASFALAWPIYAGDPQYTVMLAAAALAASVRTPAKRLAMRFALLLPLALLAGAPQILPLASHLSPEARSAPLEKQTSWSLHPLRLAEAVLPLRLLSTPNAEMLEASPLVNSPNRGAFPFFFSIYAGCVAAMVLLLTLALRARRFGARHAVASISWLAVTLLALGSWSPVPLYALFYKIVPLWSGFRYPERLSFWVTLPIALAAMPAAERLLRFRRARNLGTALAALVALDLLLAAPRLIWPQSLALLDPKNLPPVSRILAAGDPGAGPRRFLSLLERDSLDPAKLGRVSLLNLDTAQAWLSLRANTSAYFGIENAIGHASLPEPRIFLRSLCPDSACEIRTAELLSVRHVLKPGASGPEVTELGTALPYAFTPDSALPAGTAEEGFRLVKQTSFDFHHRSAVEGLPDERNFARWEVVSMRRQWDRIEVSVRAKKNGPGLLMVQEAFAGGWSPSPPLPLHRANGWAMAVELPESAAGTEIHFTLSYEEASFRYGLLAFAFWLAALGWLSSRRAAGAARGARQV